MKEKEGNNNLKLLVLVVVFTFTVSMMLELGQVLQVRQEIRNLHDPFTIFLGAKIREKLTDFDVAGHNPREISLFCRFFLNCEGLKLSL